MISFTSITWLQLTMLIFVTYSSCIYTSEIRQCHENQSTLAATQLHYLLHTKGKPHSCVIVLSAYSTVAKQSHSHLINQPAPQKNTLAHHRTMTPELPSMCNLHFNQSENVLRCMKVRGCRCCSYTLQILLHQSLHFAAL